MVWPVAKVSCAQRGPGLVRRTRTVRASTAVALSTHSRIGPDITMSGKPRVPVAGEVPNPLDPPGGCTFNPRCPYAKDKCRVERPPLAPFDGADVACHGIHDGWIPIRSVAHA